MNITEVKAFAKSLAVKPGKMKKEELIRSIQLAEGNSQCFNTNFSQQCGQDGCVWRTDCD